MDKEYRDLKEALEYQVDIVLRLEEERQLLQKENQMYKQKSQESNQILQKYIGRQLLLVEKATQAEPEEDISDYSLTESQLSNRMSQLTQQSEQKTQSELSNPYQEAKSLLKGTARTTIKTLKFCGDSKENSQEINIQKKEQLNQKIPQVEQLTREIIKLNKELKQQSLQLRAQSEQIKKYEKDNQDLHKSNEVKNEMLTKLRHELAEMAIIFNQDKFKSIRQLDNELKESQQTRNKLQQLLQQSKAENAQLQTDLKQFREVLGKLTEEYEKQRNNEFSVENEKSDLKEHEKLLNEELKIKDQTIAEFKSQITQLCEETNYFKQISIKQKAIVQAQEEDLDFYRELLVKHQIIKS